MVIATPLYVDESDVSTQIKLLYVEYNAEVADVLTVPTYIDKSDWVKMINVIFALESVAERSNIDANDMTDLLAECAVAVNAG
jgi:hypothetical protein